MSIVFKEILGKFEWTNNNATDKNVLYFEQQLNIAMSKSKGLQILQINQTLKLSEEYSPIHF